MDYLEETTFDSDDDAESGAPVDTQDLPTSEVDSDDGDETSSAQFDAELDETRDLERLLARANPRFAVIPTQLSSDGLSVWEGRI